MEVLFNLLECLGEVLSIHLTENWYNFVGDELIFSNTGVNPNRIIHTTYTPPIKFGTGLYLPVADSWACLTNQ